MRSRSAGYLLTGAMLIVAGLGAWSAAEPTRWPVMVAMALLWGAATVGAYSLTRWSAGAVLVVAVLLRLLWAWLPPGLSDDSYRYAWDGELVVRGVNPYRWVPADPALEDLRDDPVWPLLNSREYHSVYPPVTQYAFGAASLLSAGDFQRWFYAWKAILLLLELVGLVLLARMIPTGMLLMVAWNPLMVLAGAGQAHTEVLLALPLALVIWAGRSKRGDVMGLALSAAAMIKIWPVFAAAALLRHRRAVLIASATGAVTATPFFAPYVIGNVMESLDLYVRYFEFNAGPYYAAKGVLRWLTGEDWSKQLGPFFRLLFFGGAVLISVRSVRARWAASTTLYAIASLYLLLATTVHPWYFYPVLFLAAVHDRPDWAWTWLATVSIGTYLLYTDGPYWVFVWLGWGGFLCLGIVQRGPQVLQLVLRRRARWKAEWMAPHLGKEGRILDLGGGEGYVAVEVTSRTGAHTQALELGGSPRVAVDYDLYDGARFPYSDASFGMGYAVFVLHHADDPVHLLRELRRATRGRVVVVESVYRSTVGRRVLTVLDRLANGLRTMKWRDQGPLEFRSAQAWRDLFASAGYHITGESGRYNLLHQKHLFVLDPVDGQASPDGKD